MTKEKKKLNKTPKKEEEQPIKRLYRSQEDRILVGVCGGMAEYLRVDPVLIRLIWVVGTFFWGFGLLAYLVAWIIIPEKN